MSNDTTLFPTNNTRDLTDFMVYLWRTRRFDRTRKLQTTQRTSLDVLQFGNFNLGNDATPTFSEGRVRIGETVWAGHIQILHKPSDWHTKRLTFNPEYDNVVLLVVWDDDEPVLNARGHNMPVLVLSDYADDALQNRYEKLVDGKNEILCDHRLQEVPSLVMNGWLERMMLQWIEKKANGLHDLIQTRRDSPWDTSIAILLARTLMPSNVDAIDSLFERLGDAILTRYRSDRMAMEALILGTAGLITDNYLDEYPRQLQREYEHFQRKHGLETMDASAWDMKGRKDQSVYLGLVRVAAVCSDRTLGRILKAVTVEEAYDAFQKPAKPIHPYWMRHTAPDEPSDVRTDIYSKTELQRVMRDVLVPTMFLYGRLHGRSTLEDNAIALLESLPTPKNQSFNRWRQAGVVAENAHEHVALDHLYENYCTPKRCLECAIGHCLLKKPLPTEA